MPTTLRPSTVTSPGPRPAKHTSLDHVVRHQRAAVHDGATDTARRQRRRPRLTQPVRRPADVVVPERIAGGAGSRRPTAPRRARRAPLPRRCGGAPPRCPRAARLPVDASSGCVEPRTRARCGRPRGSTPSRRGRRRDARVACSSPADPADRRSTAQRQLALAEVRLPDLGHAADRRPPPTPARAAGVGMRSRRISASSGVRSRLRRLHGRHAAATFSHTCWPPRLRGMTWSIESAWPPQYWHVVVAGEDRPAATAWCAGGTAPSPCSAAG